VILGPEHAKESWILRSVPLHVGAKVFNLTRGCSSSPAVTGADVIQSFTCPALGFKCDAYPGRLNQVASAESKTLAVCFGQAKGMTIAGLGDWNGKLRSVGLFRPAMRSE